MWGTLREKYVPVIVVNEITEKEMDRVISRIELEECNSYLEAYESIRKWITENVDSSYNKYAEREDGNYKDSFKYVHIEKRFTYDYLD